MRNKKNITRTSAELAKALGLDPLDSLEWELRYSITKKIIQSYVKSGHTVTELARMTGTSRARITKVLKEDTYGISLDVLVRILGAVGAKVKITFEKAA